MASLASLASCSDLISRLAERICSSELNVGNSSPENFGQSQVLARSATWPRINKHMRAVAYTILLDYGEAAHTALLDMDREHCNAMQLAQVHMRLSAAQHTQAEELDRLLPRFFSATSIALGDCISTPPQGPIPQLVEHTHILSLLLSLSTVAHPSPAARTPADSAGGTAWPLLAQPSAAQDLELALPRASFRPASTSAPVRQPHMQTQEEGHLLAHNMQQDWLPRGQSRPGLQDPCSLPPPSPAQHVQCLAEHCTTTPTPAGDPDAYASTARFLALMSALPTPAAWSRRDGTSQPLDAARMLGDGLCHLQLLSQAAAPQAAKSGRDTSPDPASEVPGLGVPTLLSYLPGVLDMDSEPGSWTAFDGSRTLDVTTAGTVQGQQPHSTGAQWQPTLRRPDSQWNQGPNHTPLLAEPAAQCSTACPDIGGAAGGDVQPAASEVQLLRLVLLALQGTVSAVHALRSVEVVRSSHIRCQGQSKVLARLLQCADCRLRLEAFLQAHSGLPVAEAHLSAGAQATMGDSSLTAFVCCVSRLVARYDAAVQRLDSDVLPASGTGQAASHCSSSTRPQASHAAATSDAGRMTLLRLVLLVEPLRVQLLILAGACLCTPTRQSATATYDAISRDASGAHAHALMTCLHGGVAQGGLGMPVSLWMVQPFPTGHVLLGDLYTGLVQADSSTAGILRHLFTAAAEPYLKTLHDWLFAANDTDTESTSGNRRRALLLPPFLAHMQHEVDEAGRQQQLLKQLQPRIGNLVERLAHVRRRELQSCWAEARVRLPAPGTADLAAPGASPGRLGLVFTAAELQQVSETTNSASQACWQELERSLALLDRRRKAAAAAEDMAVVAAMHEYEARQEAARESKEAAAAEARTARAALLVAQQRDMAAAEQSRRDQRSEQIAAEQQVLMAAVMQEHAAAVAALQAELGQSRAADARRQVHRGAEELRLLRARAQWRMKRLGLASQRLSLLQGVEAQELHELKLMVQAGRASLEQAAAFVDQQGLATPATLLASTPVPALAATPRARDQTQTPYETSGPQAAEPYQAAAVQPGMFQAHASTVEQMQGVATCAHSTAVHGATPVLSGADLLSGQQGMAGAGEWVSGPSQPEQLQAAGLAGPGRRRWALSAPLQPNVHSPSIPRGPAPHGNAAGMLGGWQAGFTGNAAMGQHQAVVQPHRMQHQEEEEEEAVAISSVVEVCVVLPALWQYRLTTAAVWRLMTEELGLMDMLASLRRYFFFEAGDFAQQLKDSLCARWQPLHAVGGSTAADSHAAVRWGLASQHSTAAALSEALASCPSCVGDAHAALLQATLAQRNRDVFGAAGGQGHGGGNVYGLGPGGAADALLLLFRVPWPLDQVLCGAQQTTHQQQCAASGAWVTGTYSDIASALLRLRMCAAALQRAWLVVGKPTALHQHTGLPRAAMAISSVSAVQLGPDEHAAMARRLAGVRGWLAEALHFVCALQRHATSSLLGTCWQRFEREMTRNGALDLGQMTDCHMRYVARAAAFCFLPAADTSSSASGSRKLLQQAVVRAFALCEAVASRALAFVGQHSPDLSAQGTPGPGATEDPYPQLVAAHQQCSRALQHVYQHLKSGQSATSSSSGLTTHDDHAVGRSLMSELDCDWYQRRAP